MIYYYYLIGIIKYAVCRRITSVLSQLLDAEISRSKSYDHFWACLGLHFCITATAVCQLHYSMLFNYLFICSIHILQKVQKAKNTNWAWRSTGFWQPPARTVL